MYPEYLVEPMRAELTNVGFEEMKTAEDDGPQLFLTFKLLWFNPIV